jgi:ribosomal protein L5
LLASERAFSAFFALASANLVHFSALTLAAVAASKAFLEAASLASNDEMRALAIAKASAVHQKRKEKSSKEAKKSIQNKQSIGKKITLRGSSSLQVLDTFISQGDKFLHQVLSRNSM